MIIRLGTLSNPSNMYQNVIILLTDCPALVTSVMRLNISKCLMTLNSRVDTRTENNSLYCACTYNSIFTKDILHYLRSYDVFICALTRLEQQSLSRSHQLIAAY